MPNVNLSPNPYQVTDLPYIFTATVSNRSRQTVYVGVSASDGSPTSVAPGSSAQFTITGPVYAWASGNTDAPIGINLANGPIVANTDIKALIAGGGGGGGMTSPSIVGGNYSPGLGPVYFPFSRSGTLASLKAFGNAGSLDLAYVTAAQYAAAPNTATGTAIGTITLGSGGVQTSALTRAVTKGDFLRVSPTISSGTIGLYGEVA